METKHSENKKKRTALRQSMLSIRRNLSALDIEDAGYKIANILVKHPKLQQERIIGSYVSTSGELSSRNINASLLKIGHTLALPRIDIEHKGLMDFYRFDKDDELVENRFHILEPENNPERFLGFEQLEVLIVPLVAFDRQGNRLGMGGGYYDRALKKLSAECLTIGVAYDFQCIDEVPVERWDMPLDEIITPTKHLIF
ncbi:MAG: 5-formyltetrahydrofolate cyclo-ligase [Succinatimonas sp.]|nr:5-formyltetrahydrofolate cyclo-ligase [Succinatimonas sp.]